MRGDNKITGIGSVDDALRSSGLPEVDARALLCHVLGVGHAWLIAHGRDALDSAPAAVFAALSERRRAGEPVAYLVGSREFYGLAIQVTPAVLIPRPETELLVDLALDRLSPDDGRQMPVREVLDLGTGSGCVALAIASKQQGVMVSAADVSAPALEVARGNAAALAVNVAFIESNWYDAFAGRCFDLIVANPPYINPGDPHLAAGDLRFEPAIALTPPGDGLSAIRTIVAGAPRQLKAGGWLLFEHGYDQAAQCRDLLTAAGFAHVQSWRDLAGTERVSGGQMPA